MGPPWASASQHVLVTPTPSSDLLTGLIGASSPAALPGPVVVHQNEAQGRRPPRFGRVINLPCCLWSNADGHLHDGERPC